MPHRKGGADRAAGIARGRLYPDILEGAVAENFAVGDAIERDAASEAEIVDPMLARERPREPQHHFLGHLLDRGGDVHMERREQVFARSRTGAPNRSANF